MTNNNSHIVNAALASGMLAEAERTKAEEILQKYGEQVFYWPGFCQFFQAFALPCFTWNILTYAITYSYMWGMDKLRTSLRITPPVWRAFRLACLKRNTTCGEAIEGLLIDQLEAWGEAIAAQPAQKGPTRQRPAKKRGPRA